MKKLPYVLLVVSILLAINSIFVKHTSAREIISIDAERQRIEKEIQARIQSRIFNIPTIPTKTISPTPTKSQTTPTPTIKVSLTPTPSNTPIPTINPPTTNDKKTFIMNAINQYRKSRGLSEVKTDPYTCGFAATRAKEIAANFNHDGFTNRLNSGTLPYPSFSLITENLAMTSDYRNVVNMWINSSGHAANMQKDTPFVCVENSGNYYAYEGWKP